MRSSSATTSWASSTSWCSTASSVRSSAELTRSRPSRALASSRSQLLLVLGPRLRRHQPNFPVTYCSVRSSSGVVKSLSVGPTSTSSPSSMKTVRVGDPRRLLHVVGDDDDRHPLLQLADQLLDLQRRHRVQRRAGLVHQQHLRVRPRARGRCRAAAAGRRRGPTPGPSRRSLTSSQRPAPTRASRPRSSISPREAPVSRRPGGDVVEDRHRRERDSASGRPCRRRGARRRCRSASRRGRARRAGPAPRPGRRRSPRACG